MTIENELAWWRHQSLKMYEMIQRPPYTEDEAIEKALFLEDFRSAVNRGDHTLGWEPIETFNGGMFSIMTNGLPEGTEVVKYKGEVPGWATHWRPLPRLP